MATNILDISNHVQQQGLLGQKQGQQSLLQSLAPKIMQGDAQAYTQAATIDPKAAEGYQNAGDAQLRKLQGYIKYVDGARATGNPAAVNAALRAGSSLIGQYTGKPGPTEWTPDLDEGWEFLKGKVAQLADPSAKAQDTTPAAIRELQMLQANPELAKLDMQRRQSGGWQLVDIPDGNGGTIQRERNPYTNEYRIPNYGSGQSSATGGAPSPQQPSAALGSDHMATFQSLTQEFPGTQLTSTTRTPEHNREVGGVPNSQHLRGTAGDFVVPQSQKARFMAVAKQQGYEAIDEGDHIHLELPPGAQVASAGGGLGYKPPKPDVSPAEAARLRLAEEANARAAAADRRAEEDAKRRRLGTPPAGMRWNADETSLEPIPGAPAAAGNASEDERKAAGWYGQATRALANMREAITADPEADTPGIIETYSPLDELANRSRDPNRQRYVNASSSLSEALLRAATGAGVNESEARQKIAEVTPQRGDRPEVKAQKMAAAEGYLQDLQARAGRALRPAAQGSQSTGGRTVVRRGRLPDGRSVVQYSDGTADYGN